MYNLYKSYTLDLESDTQVIGHSRLLGPLERSRFLTTSETTAEVVPSPVTEELLLASHGVREAKRSYVFMIFMSSLNSKCLILSFISFFFTDLYTKDIESFQDTDDHSVALRCRRHWRQWKGNSIIPSALMSQILGESNFISGKKGGKSLPAKTPK